MTKQIDNYCIEKVGIGLKNILILIKAIQVGVYYKDYIDNKIKKTTNLSLTNYNKTGYSVVNKSHYFSLSDYGTSWALTKGELELL